MFSKDEILTLYLNTVSFGENVYGIEAASARFFNKSTESLKLEESAVWLECSRPIPSTIRVFIPKMQRSRRNVVFKQMEKYKYLEAKDC